MKYFKQMKESKRKISFIMALALIVSLLPVSPVTKAAATEVQVYIDNQVEGTKVSFENQASTPGAIKVTVESSTGTPLTADAGIKIAVTKSDGTGVVSTKSAIATDAAVGSVSLVCGATSFASGKFTCEVSGITEAIKITVTASPKEPENEGPQPGPTDPPSTVASVGAISANNQEVLLEKLTDDEKNEVKAGTAHLELKPESTLAPLPNDAEKEAIANCLNDSKNSSIKNVANKFVNAGNSFVFDLVIKLIYVKNGSEVDKGEVNSLAEPVEVTMEIPSAYRNTNASILRTYFIIRIHEENGVITADVLDCTTSGNNFTFKSDKFSKFILCYKDVNKSWNGAGTVSPTPSASATSDASAAPTATAAPDASAAPTTDPTTSAGTATPDNTPDTGNNGTDNPGVTNTSEPTGGDGSTSGTGSSSSKVKKGQKYTVNGIKYEIISTDSTKTVGFVNNKKNAKKVTIPATVKIKGKTFKVKTIQAGAFKNNKKLTSVTIGANVKIIEKNAFKGCNKLKNIVIKSKKLTVAKVAKNAFKGINKKATVKVPKNKVKAYTKIVKTKGGAGNSVKVTK